MNEIKDKKLYYYFGTPTLSFEYDNNTSKMKIDSCHLPIYDGINGNKIINILENINTNIPYEFLIINQNAGIFFTDAQPTSFWFDKLGFTKDFIPHFKTDFYMTDPLGQTTLYYPESLEEGKYTTGQYLGLDILIPKIRPDSTTSEIFIMVEEHKNSQIL